MESMTVWFGDNQSCIKHYEFGGSPHKILNLQPVHAYLHTLLSPDAGIFTRDAGIVNFEFARQETDRRVEKRPKNVLPPASKKRSFNLRGTSVKVRMPLQVAPA